MANQISKQANLLKYLSQEVITTKGFIKRCSNSVNLIVESDDISLEMYDKGQNLLNDIESYTFRLQWLESQINEVKKDLDISK